MNIFAWKMFFSRRNLLISVSFVILSVVYAVHLFVPQSYAGTRYWVPKSKIDEKQLEVLLHWKPGKDVNPVVHTEGCSEDMSSDDPMFNPSSDIRLSELSNQLTIVTAYFHIPEYRKAALCWFCNQTTRDLYRQWMTSFALIENPVIAYLDNDEDFEYFRAIRRHVARNKTCLVRVDRTRMWAFSEKNRRRVRNITDSDGYLHFYPNTVIADYSLTQNAKYEVMQMSIRRNPYRTRYVAWLDIGLFRAITTPTIASRTSSGELRVDVPSGQSRFRLDFPSGFDSNRSIAFSETFVRDPTLTPKAVIFRTKVWVSGAYFVGRLDRMYCWTQDYLRSYEWLIKNNLTNTDEQVIYAIHNAIDQGILKPFKSKLQPYKRDSRFSEYFNVGYQSRVMLDTAATASANSIPTPITLVVLLAVVPVVMVISKCL